MLANVITQHPGFSLVLPYFLFETMAFTKSIAALMFIIISFLITAKTLCNVESPSKVGDSKTCNDPYFILKNLHLYNNT